MVIGLLNSIQIDILSVDFHRPGAWWCNNRVNSPYSRLYFITEGEAYVTHSEQVFHLTPGNLYLIPAFTFCDLHCPEQFAVYHINFTAELKGGGNLFSAYDYDYCIEGHGESLDIFKRLMQLNPSSRLDNLSPYYNLRKSLTASNDIDLTVKTCPFAGFEANALIRLLLVPFLKTMRPTQSTRKVNKRLCEVFRFIDQNLSRPISLKEMAGVLYLNATYFSNFFTEMTGIRPTEYIRRKRIEKAQTLLLSTAFTVKELADQLGFASASHFSHTFKKSMGICPQEYRRHHAKL